MVVVAVAAVRVVEVVVAVAAVVEEIVHAHSPAPRYVIGASFEMRFLIPYIPQRLLDAGTRMQLRRA